MKTHRKTRSQTVTSGRRKDKVRYAVVGMGHIAQVAVLPAFSHAENSELNAIVTDDPVKARQLAKKYCLPAVYSYDDYEQCLESGEIDAVYIALPNSIHRDFAVAAANAGVHVLCEKPMAVDERQCEEMIQAADKNQVKLMVAYRLHFDKANLRAVELVQSRKLGEPRIFNSTFSLQVKPGNIRLSRDLGGGPLWDIGVYCINAARYLFRSEPEEVFAFENNSRDKRFKEVQESVSAILKFPGAELASFACSFGAADASAYEVVCTKGSLRADPAYEYAESLKLTIKTNGKTREQTFPKSDQFAPELVYFSDCVLKNREPEPSGREGLADVRIIRALYESLEKDQPVEIRPVARDKRPSAAQEIRRPPVQKPELVRVAGASD